MVLSPPFNSSTATAPLVAQKSQDTEESIVLSNMSFFPDIELFDFQTKFRVDGSHFVDRQTQALQEAMIDVNDVLLDDSTTDEGVSWVAKHLAEGYEHITQIPGTNYGEVSDKVFTYLTAVYAKAKEILVENWPDLFIGKNTSRNDPEMDTAQNYRNQSLSAVYKLMGQNSFRMEMI